MASQRKVVLGMWMLTLGLLAIPLRGTASTSIQFIPSPPEYQQPLAVRLADSRGLHCWPQATSIVRQGHTVTLTLTPLDLCAAADVRPYRDYALGSFRAGAYLFVYQSCFDNPPPLPSGCITVLQVPFSVAPPPVPALSWWAMLALAAGVLSVLARVRRLRQPRRQD